MKPVDHPHTSSPFKIRNIRLFIYFRVFFNSRFYYPIFTILFLDFGLTIEQFALLNVAWAASIVLLEIPSGALADIIGRKNLLVFAAVVMVVEISLLCFVPRGNPNILFVLFLINRLLSGTAEAAASGADEALAYDSLKKEGDVSNWPRVLEKQMRVQAIGFLIVMSLGAAVYDPMIVEKLTSWFGLNIFVSQDVTLRFPLYLTLGMAVLTLITTLRMRETRASEAPDCSQDESADCGYSVVQAFKLTLQAGGWILKTPFALVIILTGLVFDNSIRMVMTLSSQYYRLIDLPEATFGLIGSGMAVIGMFIPRFALRLVNSRSPLFNIGIITILALGGLTGMSFFFPVIGLIPVMLLSGVMYMLNFFQSHYLNKITSSDQRATVLSFKGLSLNLAYGIVGILYSLLVAFLRRDLSTAHPGIIADTLENMVFIKSIGWFPLYFLLTFAVLIIVARRQLRGTDVHRTIK